MDTKEIIKADAKVSANTVNEIYQGCFTRKGQIKKLFGPISQGRCPNMASERETTLPKRLVGFFRGAKPVYAPFLLLRLCWFSFSGGY